MSGVDARKAEPREEGGHSKGKGSISIWGGHSHGREDPSTLEWKGKGNQAQRTSSRLERKGQVSSWGW